MNLENFLFGVYPYIAGVVFILGSWIRFDREQYTWKTDSSQLLCNSGMRFASNLFHIGIIGIFFGHAIGMLLPHSWWQMIVTNVQHQYIAIYVGMVFGGMVTIGSALLLLRRISNERVKAVSRFRDNFIIFWLLLVALLGLSTILDSMSHASNGDATIMLTLAEYVKSIAMLSVDPSLVANVEYSYKLHMLFGMTIFLVFPFTRLVHVWSVPLTYLIRPYQIVRSKYIKTH